MLTIYFLNMVTVTYNNNIFAYIHVYRALGLFARPSKVNEISAIHINKSTYL